MGVVGLFIYPGARIEPVISNVARQQIYHYTTEEGTRLNEDAESEYLGDWTKYRRFTVI